MSSFVSPFASRKNYVSKGQDNWDTDYIDYKIKDIVKKTGEGEEDFVIVQKITEVRTPIQEVVDRDAGTTGIKALMERVALTGDDTLLNGTAISKDGVTSDYTKCPGDLMEVDLMAKRAVAAYDALPDEIKKGRSFNDFCNSFTTDEYALWVASLVKANKKADEKKDGDE